MDSSILGRWAFIIGIVLAVLAGFIDVPALAWILFILGLIVGFLNVKEKESTSFLVAVVTLLVIGLAGNEVQLGTLTATVQSILGNFVAFVAAAGLIVAIKQAVAVSKPGA